MTVAVAGRQRRRSVAVAVAAADFSRATVSPRRRERSHGAEVLVDVEHGGIQQSVDVLQALQPGL